VAGADIDRQGPRPYPQRDAHQFAAIDQRRGSARLVRQRALHPPAQQRFGDADRRHVEQHAEMRRDAAASRMGATMPIDEQQAGFLGHALPRGDQSRRLAKTEIARHIGEGRYLCDGRGGPHVAQWPAERRDRGVDRPAAVAPFHRGITAGDEADLADPILLLAGFGDLALGAGRVLERGGVEPVVLHAGIAPSTAAAARRATSGPTSPSAFAAKSRWIASKPGCAANALSSAAGRSARRVSTGPHSQKS
jgi:hypothetical protein